MRTATALASQELPLPGAESMLLVHDGKAEVGELDLIFDQRVRAHQDRAVTRSSRRLDAPPLRCTESTDEQLDPEVGKGRLEVSAELAPVLPGEHLRRRHDHRLQPGGGHHRGPSRPYP